jgi:hypothetical protein
VLAEHLLKFVTRLGLSRVNKLDVTETGCLHHDLHLREQDKAKAAVLQLCESWVTLSSMLVPSKRFPTSLELEETKGQAFSGGWLCGAL